MKKLFLDILETLADYLKTQTIKDIIIDLLGFIGLIFIIFYGIPYAVIIGG